jgi:hypothetical protein
MNNNETSSNDYMNFEVELHEKNYFGAKKVCFSTTLFSANRLFGFLFQSINKIIDDLKKQTTADKPNKSLIVYLFKRIKLNFDLLKYKGSFSKCFKNSFFFFCFCRCCRRLCTVRKYGRKSETTKGYFPYERVSFLSFS